MTDQQASRGDRLLIDDPHTEPEVQAANLESRIEAALNELTGRSRSDEEAATIMGLLREQGWVIDGVPSVTQVLADARQFSDELVLTKLVARFFRVMILGAVIIPETPAIMEWLRDYIDGNNRLHGPLGKPMIWPDRLTACTGLLRDWGFQPTPTNPPYVSVRPGGKMTRTAPDPTAPDPAMVAPLPRGREEVMGALLDSTAGTLAVMAVDRMTAIRAMSAAFDRGATHVAEGFVVLSGDKMRYRTWVNSMSAWTEDLTQATRYARREDAEAVHREDDDAWCIWPYATAEEEQS